MVDTVLTNNEVGIVSTMDSKMLCSLLVADGWILRSIKGSHHVFRHPHRRGIIVVPHPRKDLGKGLTSRILKDAGIERH